MLQFWNLFNARYFRTKEVPCRIFGFVFNRKRFRESASVTLLLVAGIILLGQYIITNFAGAFFDVAPLSWVTGGLYCFVHHGADYPRYLEVCENLFRAAKRTTTV